MILAKFFSLENKIVGFEISGHSGYAEQGSDIICASVSSCAYMVANTVTEIYRVEAEVEDDEGFLSLSVPASQAERLESLFKGFRLHLSALAKDYRGYLRVKNVSINK